MAAILKSAQKGGGGPTYKAKTSRLFIDIYSIPIGFSDLENVGLDTKFVFLAWLTKGQDMSNSIFG